MGYSAVRQAAPARASGESKAGACVTWAGECQGAGRGLDNWITANGNEGERALADMPAGGDFGRL
jgi:hypothetical protein